MPLIPFIGGNWKCNGTKESITALIALLNNAEITHDAEVVVCSSFLHLDSVKSSITHPKISVGAQNCYVKQGAFTGEVSADQLADFGIKWVIIGHSERRHIFKESNEDVAAKITAAQKAGLSVIACLGETQAERDAGRTEEICTSQLKAIANSVQDWNRVVLAYEPVWAIGTGNTATPQQAQDVHHLLRNSVAELSGSDIATTTRIIYGGSVTEKNAKELFAEPDINGFLVGGASLKPAFLDIIAASL